MSLTVPGIQVRILRFAQNDIPLPLSCQPGEQVRAAATARPYTSSMTSANEKEVLRPDAAALRPFDPTQGNEPKEQPQAIAPAPDGAGKRASRLSLFADPLPWLALAFVFAADQVSKTFVIRLLTRFESWPADGFFRFTHAWNTGTAFGLFPQYGGLLTIVSLAAVVVLALFYKAAKNPPVIVRIAFGMQLGGAFGNLFDRVRIGHVTDFIDIGPWPVFNLADSSIVVGIALMAWHFWNAASAEEPAKHEASLQGAPGAPSEGPRSVATAPTLPTPSTTAAQRSPQSGHVDG